MEELIKFAATVLGLQDSEVSQLVKDGDKLKDGAVATLLEKHKAKVASDAEEAKKKSDEKADNFYKKGAKETHEKYMASLAEFGIDKNLPAEDALKALEAKRKELIEAGGDEAKILKTDVFIRNEKRIREEMGAIHKKEIDALTEQLNKTKSEFETKELRSVMRQKFEEEAGLLTFVDGIAPEQLKFIKDSAFETWFSNNQFKNIDGVWIPVDQNGEAKKNAHGHFMKLEDTIADATKVLPVKAGVPKKTFGQEPGGAGGGGGGGAYTGKLQLPKDITEFSNLSNRFRADKASGKITGEDFDAWNKAAQEALEKAPAA